ncbi:predicted protein [Naegleria gruberi]|uniref:Predicted protein n=1 Tax=Naegleria gruberi TaxID=5762 RepID=D2VDL1_NAEGR|nr:uncharacterized protein NAEGRDRAFT_66957 [Naegleria gruberi]EFC45019.1 predicted protein [Naegleria gruberi]|eukprot:XP_002677763.1 predicted protein [Naegleria gruberi strain NEG-M]
MTKPLVLVFSILLLTILAASFTLAADGLAKTQENVSVVVNLNLAAKGKTNSPAVATPQPEQTSQPEEKKETPQPEPQNNQVPSQPVEPVKEEKPATHERLTNQDESSSSVNFEAADEKTKAGTLSEALKSTITPFDERVIAGNLLYFAEDLNAIVEAIPTQTSEQKQVKSQLMLIVSNLLSKTSHPGADLLKNTLSATVASASAASSSSGGAQTLENDETASETSLESTEHVGHYSNSISSAANYVAGPIAKTLAHIGLGNMSRRAQQLGMNLNRFSETHVATIENTIARNIAPVLKTKSLSEIRGTLKKVQSAISSGKGFTALGLNKRIYMPSTANGIKAYIKKHNDKVRKQVGVKSLKDANSRLNNYKKVFVNKKLVTKFKGADKKIRTAGKSSKKSSSKSSLKSSTSSKRGVKGAKKASKGVGGRPSSKSAAVKRGGKKSSSSSSSRSRGSVKRSSASSSSSRQVKKKKTSSY